jgi:hypothetical protein
MPLLLIVVGRSLLGAVRERMQTGEWPRNEAFVARTKRRRAESESGSG